MKQQDDRLRLVINAAITEYEGFLAFENGFPERRERMKVIRKYLTDAAKLQGCRSLEERLNADPSAPSKWRKDLSSIVSHVTV